MIQDYAQILIEFVREHRNWAAPIVRRASHC